MDSAPRRARCSRFRSPRATRRSRRAGDCERGDLVARPPSRRPRERPPRGARRPGPPRASSGGILAAVGARLHDLPSREPEPAALDQRAEPVQRRREPHRPLREPPVRCGVDLLRGQVEHVLLAPRRPGRRTEPARDLEQPDSEVGAGTPETECPEWPLLQHRSALVQRRDVAPPRVDGVRFVEARDRRDLRPEPLGVGLAEQASRPSLGRTCDHGPGGRQTGRQVAHDLPRAPRLGPCGSRRIDVREQLRIGVAKRDDERGALGIEGGGLQPGWGAIQQLVGGVERVQAPDVVVDVEAHDVSGAGAPAPSATARSSGACSGSP